MAVDCLFHLFYRLIDSGNNKNITASDTWVGADKEKRIKQTGVCK